MKKSNSELETVLSTGNPSWLSSAVFYQIYPQSYCDSNGDGIGDIPGIIAKLDYLSWLGINAIWINPCFVSPFQDAGYDVADYLRVAPRYGTNRDLDRLCREAHQRGIRVCLDLVAGHTSIEHTGFKASCRHRKNRYTNRYVWTSAAISDTDTGLSVIRGYGERDGNFVANCFYFQPALNYGFAEADPDKPWQQPVDAPGPRATRRELLRIMDFWLGRGVDGFRVDMAFSLVKNDLGRKETIKLWQDVGTTIRSRYPDMVLISEWGNPEESIAAGFDIDFMLHFGVGGYPDLMLNENCFFRRRGGNGIADFLQSYLGLAEKTRGKGLISIPSANHDIKRPRSDGRTLGDLKVIFTFLLMWPGVPFIYYGDEIGMRYLAGLVSKEGGYDRTGSRTPMQWDGSPSAGFSSAEKALWYLPLDPRKNRPDVAGQSDDPDSLLHHVRTLIRLRKESPALQAEGRLIPLPVDENLHCFAWLRQAGGERYLVAVNPSNEPAGMSFDALNAGGVRPLLSKGVKARIDGQSLRISMNGVSSGVFRLD
jgi:maltose alpha-D-glucosyltransferase/alpha-amylase